MRKTPSQHKGDGKPRVTLRLHPIKSRDEKRRNVPVVANVLTANCFDMDAKVEEVAAEPKGAAAEESLPATADVEKPSSDKAADEAKGVQPDKEVEAKRVSPDQPPSGGVKRSLVEPSDTAAEDGEDESKKKKRRDSDAGKDGATRNPAVGRPAAGLGKNAGVGADKAAKPPTGAKTVTAVSTTKVAGANILVDRKSPTGVSNPVPSPKPASAKPTEVDDEAAEEMPLAKSTSAVEGGPKVPPLKIVIPQQMATLEQEQGARNGKNGKSHQALPYVVASSNGNDSASDKDAALNAGSANPSPTECGNGSKVGEEKKDPLLGNLTAEERSTHQRVLRSSNRSGGSSCSSSSGGQPAGVSGVNPSAGSNASSPQPGSCNNSVGDRNSNNSSPHQSSTSRCQSPATGDGVVPPVAPVEPNVANPTATPPPTEAIVSEPVEAPSQPPPPPPPPVLVASVELHPRKRKLKQTKESQAAAQSASTSLAAEPIESPADKPDVHPHDQPITNCYQLFLDIRKQIERRRKGLFPVQPKPPSGFKDYLMNRCTYVLAGNSSSRLSIPNVTPPQTLQGTMKELFAEQEKERYRLRMQHVIEKEKLVLSVEQEILRVHGRAARALANQSLPFSVCTILKDEEVYNIITPETLTPERSRYNGRLFISWLQDVDDKWEKIKESMLLRHHNEAESLHAVQKMDWEWKMKELGICEFKAKPVIEELHVPMVHVSDDFDLLPA